MGVALEEPWGLAVAPAEGIIPHDNSSTDCSCMDDSAFMKLTEITMVTDLDERLAGAKNCCLLHEMQ
ncbi:MAG: hypothetical protein EA401_10945 [Planctomycetota bacterium]|nr:MAG: hypothetical protein EA401_10945 [Planctomycetota bacterium]